MNCYSPNFQGFILMKNALNNKVGILGDMFLWLVENLKQGVIYLIKQEGGNHKIASVYFTKQLSNQYMIHMYVWCPTNAVSINANFTNFILRFNFTLIKLDYLFHVLIMLFVSFCIYFLERKFEDNFYYFLTKM